MNVELRRFVVSLLWVMPSVLIALWCLAWFAKQVNEEHSRRLECEELLLKAVDRSAPKRSGRP